MVKVIPFILSFILYGSASAQEHIELSIGDSWLQTPIADVQVVELNSGAIGFSNAQGIVEFSTPFAPNVDMQFEVSSAAYPTHFFERLVFDSACSNLTHFFLGLAPECDWVSPLFGSSAGTKSIQVATGQSLGQYVGDPNPVEYMQDVSFSIPANAIQAPQRFGLALPARSAWNNYQIDAVSTQPLVMAAQFRITWLDASGIPFVGAPLLFPAQVEMTAGDVLAREALLDGWEFASFTFDESHLSWSQTSPEWGGNMTEAIMSADLHEPGLYAFLLKNPQVEVSAVCQHKWLTKPWVDAPMYTEQLICPAMGNGGCQWSYSRNTTETVSKTISKDSGLTLSGLITKLGFEVNASEGDAQTYSKAIECKVELLPGQYPMMEGQLKVGYVGFSICLYYVCETEEGPIEIEHPNTCLYFKTGMAIDASDLKPCE